MATVRVVKNKDNPYVMFNKTALNDPNLSFKAKGIFAYLMSKPDDWVIYVKDLQNNSADGRDAVYGGLEELRKYGYLMKVKHRNNKGQYEWEETLFELPQEEAILIYKKQFEEKEARRKKKEEKRPLPENPDMVKKEENPLPENPDMDNPDSDNSDSEKPDILISNDLPYIKEPINEGQKNELILPVLWDNIILNIKNHATEHVFNAYIRLLEPLKIEDDVLHIKAPNEFTKGILEQRYIALINNALSNLNLYYNIMITSNRS